MSRLASDRVLMLHGAVLALLFLLQFVLPAYHHTNLARIMLLATFASGYNLLYGYTGLLSLGHAMFFSAGLYGAGLSAHYWGLPPLPAFLLGAAAGLGLATAVGLVALRTSGVSFMIVTLMFAQALFLTTLYFGDITRGDEGIVIAAARRQIALGGAVIPLSTPWLRYNLALLVFGASLIGLLALVRSPIGRVLVAIRDNEARARLLGYDTFQVKLVALAVSGLVAAAAGAAYALLFGYVGSTFAATQYSIDPLLYTLVGGAGTTLGPLAGAIVMFYLVDIASRFTSAHILVVGVALVLLVLGARKGLLGQLRERALPWLP